MPNTRWTYLLLVPDPLFFTEENRILTNIAVNLAAILVAGVILAVSFSFYNMIPLRKLVRSLGAQGDDKAAAEENEYGTLDHHIRSLVRNNQDLRDEITKRYEYGKTNFVDRLLKGTFTSPGERATAAIYSGLVMEHQCYALAVFELVGYNSEIHAEFLDEMDMTSTVIADFLEKRIEPNVLAHKADFNRIALLFCLDRPADPDAIRRIVSELIDEALGEMKIQVRCAVGGAIEDPDLISAAYYALVAQLQRTDARASGPILVLPGRGSSLESFFYPLEVENRLLNHLLSGNGEDAVNVVRHTIAQNRDEYRITMTCAVYLIVAMKCTFIRARNEIELSSPEDAVRFDHIVYTDKNTDLDIQLERFREATDLLCRQCQREAQHEKHTASRVHPGVHRRELRERSAVPRHDRLPVPADRELPLVLFQEPHRGEPLERHRVRPAERGGPHADRGRQVHQGHRRRGWVHQPQHVLQSVQAPLRHLTQGIFRPRAPSGMTDTRRTGT